MYIFTNVTIFCILIIFGCLGSDIDLDIIKKVNSVQTTWQAEVNHITNLSDNDKKSLAGNSKIDLKNFPMEENKRYFYGLTYIPDTFDARLKWENCPSIHAIKDQGLCSGCWAVSSASVMSDRLCISSRHRIKVNISAEDIITCCKECGDCGGGNVERAWLYFIREGVVTGGDYLSNEGCKPFSTVNCGENCTGTGIYPTPECKRNKCTNPNYHKNFNKDLHYGINMYTVPMNHRAIQNEILRHGPVVATFTIYRDFYSYKSGVYQHVTGEYHGRHSVKIIGWGTDKGTDYWLVANSWGPDWGEQGLFRIIRGRNECTIERTIVAGKVWPQ
uniref:Peptidase C1A papain C-terminal domain-containing protein n=1 Tax=Clastoptera arizonana TaxID=38151 RepID=A0A1B6CKV3_9HEMI